MAYVEPNTRVPGYRVKAVEDWNVLVNDIKDHETRLVANTSAIGTTNTNVAAISGGTYAPVSAASALDATFVTTSATYVDAGVSVNFTAPPTGRVVIHMAAEIWSSTPGVIDLAKMSCRVRKSGDGTDTAASDDRQALSKYGGDSIQATKTRLVTGLTAGATYTAYLTAARRAATSSQCNVKNPSIIVQPTL